MRNYIAIPLLLAVVSHTYVAWSQSSVVSRPHKAGDVDTATYSITIIVREIRSQKGVIRFKFYDDKTGFPHDTGFLKKVEPKSKMQGDSMIVTYTGFKSQFMGIALQDDENEDMKLDMGWFLPKEGHAFSDYYHTAWRRPVYEDFRFFLAGDRIVIMRMKYY